MYVQLVPALRNSGQEMEFSARILGASRWRRLRTITLPLVLPALLGGGILVILEAVVLFGIPGLLGSPIFFYVAATKIHQLFAVYPPQFEVAAAMTTPVLVFTVVLLVLERALLRGRSFVTVTGRGRRYFDEADLGRWKWALAAWAWLVIAMCLFLPTLAFLYMSLVKIPGNGFGLDNLTFDRFVGIFTGSDLVMQAFTNSFVLAFGAACIAIAVGFVLVWLVERTRLPIRGIITLFAIAPLGYPGIVLGIALVFAFSHPPLALYGTLWIFLVAYVIKGLPISFTFLRAAFAQIHPDLERCARVLGASPPRLLRDITLPLMRNGLLSTGLTIFAIKFRDLPTSIFLYVSGTEVLAILLYDFASEGYYDRMAALAVVVIALNLALVLAANRLAGRSPRTEA
jgi:iron(III) transport system permease protein